MLFVSPTGQTAVAGQSNTQDMIAATTPLSYTKQCYSGKKKVTSVLLGLLENLLPHIVIKLLVMLTKSSLDLK